MDNKFAQDSTARSKSGYIDSVTKSIYELKTGRDEQFISIIIPVIDGLGKIEDFEKEHHTKVFKAVLN
jgi:hypothetical protein